MDEKPMSTRVNIRDTAVVAFEVQCIRCNDPFEML
jgi:hypothetical protein